MINFAENINKMITAGLGGETEAPRTEVAVGHRTQYLDASGPVASFETNIVAPLKKLLITMEPIQAGSGNPAPDNIRPISGRSAVRIYRETEYDEEASPYVTIQLGRSVYAGTLDAVTGKLVVKWVMETLDGVQNGVRSVSIASATGNYYCTYNLANNTVSPSIANPISNMFYSFIRHAQIGTIYAATVGGVVFVLADQSLTTRDAVNAWIADGHPIQICYMLETPQEFALDPQQITTLIGDNNIWSDAGDVDVTYTYYEETEGY